MGYFLLTQCRREENRFSEVIMVLSRGSYGSSE